MHPTSARLERRVECFPSELDCTFRQLLLCEWNFPGLDFAPLFLVLQDRPKIIVRPRRGAVRLRVEPQVLHPIVFPVKFPTTEVTLHLWSKAMFPTVGCQHWASRESAADVVRVLVSLKVLASLESRLILTSQKATHMNRFRDFGHRDLCVIHVAYPLHIASCRCQRIHPHISVGTYGRWIGYTVNVHGVAVDHFRP